MFVGERILDARATNILQNKAAGVFQVEFFKTPYDKIIKRGNDLHFYFLHTMLLLL
jgi:hypothetical protein